MAETRNVYKSVDGKAERKGKLGRNLRVDRRIILNLT
jgi:hypothetical protein